MSDVLDILKEQLVNLLAAEKQTVFDGAVAMGEAHGRVLQVQDLIRKLEDDRKVVNIAGTPVETAARNPQSEKR